MKWIKPQIFILMPLENFRSLEMSRKLSSTKIALSVFVTMLMKFERVGRGKIDAVREPQSMEVR